MRPCRRWLSRWNGSPQQNRKVSRLERRILAKLKLLNPTKSLAQTTESEEKHDGDQPQMADWRLTVGFCATLGSSLRDPVARCKAVGPEKIGLLAEKPASTKTNLYRASR